MRGSQHYISRRVDEEGIIPAHAGLTRPCTHHFLSLWDHPRACGAHLPISTGETAGMGSSPRMRGSQLRIINGINETGIIPAHAGLTALTIAFSRSAKDHPRACGAHRLRHKLQSCHPGSSPRMRGSLIVQHRCTTHTGIIPAHAGLTSQSLQGQNLAGDHPRACGAH